MNSSEFADAAEIVEINAARKSLALARAIVFFAIECPECRRGTNLEFRIQWNIHESSLR
jgi:hypothetical protein